MESNGMSLVSIKVYALVPEEPTNTSFLEFLMKLC